MNSDEGRVLVFTMVLASAIAACLGLVMDGGRMLIDATRAQALAHEAARAGARELDTAELAATGIVRIDEGAAVERAEEHLHASGATGRATIDGQRVVVTAEVPYTTVILPLGGGTAQARASATAVQD
ncbi:pilus assembly protein TadG-related protein [Nocardiopsis baichengensis]|uniref:pilus assembly protein TadG-related protein n=1 Tax=Nocardiopsis baichengensis TaxID=280240 RepID=UPI001EF9EC21|nr:pilus assembly protein TadG-related protein [Nocardiopsis baichengensis]